MSGTHWTSKDAPVGSLLRLVGMRGIPWLYVEAKRSIDDAVLRLFADPRCDDDTRALVRKYLTGPENEAG